LLTCPMQEWDLFAQLDAGVFPQLMVASRRRTAHDGPPHGALADGVFGVLPNPF